MTIVVLVIVAGVAVGLLIDVVLTRRHRARQVRLARSDEVLLASSIVEGVDDPDLADRRAREEGVIVLGPVEYDPPEVASVEWDLQSDPFHDDPLAPVERPSDDRRDH